MLVGVEGVGDVPGQHECDRQGLVTLPGSSWERLEVCHATTVMHCTQSLGRLDWSEYIPNISKYK